MVVLYSSASCQYTYPCTIRQNYIATEEEVLTSIENQTEYRFLYNKDIVDVSRIVSISVKNELMTLVLDKLFKGEGVSYTIEKRQIVLNKVSYLYMFSYWFYK